MEHIKLMIQICCHIS